MYDPSRFGRIEDDKGWPDVAAYQHQYSEFTKVGWVPQFATVKASGHGLIDMMLLIQTPMAESPSVAPSRSAIRLADGMPRRHHAAITVPDLREGAL